MAVIIKKYVILKIYPKAPKPVDMIFYRGGSCRFSPKHTLAIFFPKKKKKKKSSKLQGSIIVMYNKI